MILQRRRQPPKVKSRFVGFVASSIDGRISLTKRTAPDWTSAEDWKFLQKSLKRFDAVVVGRNTYLAAQARLKKRTTYVLSRRISKIKRDGSVTFVNPEKTDLGKLLQRYRTVAVLGGAGVYQYMLDHGFLDELYVTIEPLVFGRGVTMFMGGRKNIRLVLTSVRRLNKKGTILLHYKTK